MVEDGSVKCGDGRGSVRCHGAGGMGIGKGWGWEDTYVCTHRGGVHIGGTHTW